MNHRTSLLIEYSISINHYVRPSVFEKALKADNFLRYLLFKDLNLYYAILSMVP